MNTDKLMELERKWPLDRHPDPHTDAWTLGYLRAKRECADELAAALRAEQAVGEEQIARELLASEYDKAGNWRSAVYLSRGISPGKHADIAIRAIRRALGTARQSEGVVVPNGLRVIGELLRTQDNRITDSPIFIVQQKREHVADPDYDCDRIVWVGEDNTELSAEESAAAEEHFKAEYEAPEGLRRLAVRVEWEFVTACFTEQGCKDYLARDGHNLKEPRIYAAGSYRNEEFRAVRKFLLSLAAAPGGEGEVDRG